MSTATPVFRRVRAGYEPAAVDRHLHQLATRQAAAEARVAAAEAEAADREVQLAEARAELTAAHRQTRPDLMADDLMVAARREAEKLVAAARAEAETLVARARHQAAAVDERARQEFFWRRRQLQADADELRAEQDRINRQRAQIRDQLSTLSALALQQSTAAPAVEFMLDDDLVDQAAS